MRRMGPGREDLGATLKFIPSPGVPLMELLFPFTFLGYPPPPTLWMGAGGDSEPGSPKARDWGDGWEEGLGEATRGDGNYISSRLLHLG